MKTRHSERGASMVEFAIASTALLLIVFGTVEFGRAMYSYHAVANAARIGSRWAMVRGSASCATPVGRALATCPATSDEVQTYVRSQVALADSSSLNVSAAWPGTNAGCKGKSTTQSAGCAVVVTANDTFNFALPFISTTNWTISSTSEMIISQ